VGRTLNRVAGVVSAAALATFAAAPAALAQDETSTSPTETSASTSETSTSSTTSSTTSEAPSTVPSSTSGIATADPAQSEVKTTEKRIAPEIESDPQEPPKDDDYQDNTGAGFVGLGGEGVLVINCAAGAPGNLATQYLNVTGGPDQDESDGRIWNYTVRVADAPAGTTTAKFSWTCNGIEGNGIVEFEQEQPPTTSTTVPSSTAPVTTATSTTTTTTAAPGNAAPEAQVKVAPKGGVETGFGGTAR
jgi:hypothetical protein